jgi:hypothetical protein
VNSGSRQTLSKRISDVLCTCAFDEFHGSISHHVSQEMYSYVHVTRAFAICRVLAHKDARRVFFLDLCRTMLQVGKPFKERPKVKYFLHGWASSDELRLTTA